MVAIVSGNSLGVSLSSLVTLGQSAVGGTATQGRNGEAAYVNAATGNLVLQDTDLIQSERGNQQIASVRTYNSLGSLGPDNWTKGFDLQKLSLTAGIVNTAGSIVTRTDSDGAQAAYAYNATTGLYVATDGGGAFDTISYDAVAHVYTRTDGATQARESYTSAGVLVSMTDSDGNVVTVTRNAAGQVASVIDPNGETRTYYDYDASNRLSQIRTIWTGGAQSTVVRYTYDGSNRLSTVTVDLSPTDNSIADNKTYTTTYTYVDATSSHIAGIAQKDGTSLAFTYDASFRVATITDQAGNQTTFTYDTVNANTTVTDPNKNNTVYHYDASGRLASVTAPTTGTSTATTSYTYDANGNVAQIVDGAGRTVTMSYDANGNQTLQQDGAGNTVTRTFDALDHMVTETAYVVPDPDGAGAGTASVPMTTRYVYDPAGQHLLRFVLTPEGRVTEYRYDASGNRTSTIQYGAAVYALGGMAATDVPTLAQMTAWTPTLDLTRTTRTDVAYDAWGQPTARTVWTQVDASGVGVADNKQSVTHFTYGQFGQLLNTISPLTGSTTYTYDGLGRVLTALNAAGLTTTSYDDANNKTQVTYANGLIVTSAYDKAGRLLSVTQGTSSTANLGVTQYAYDADGNLRMTTQPDGVRHYMLYDAGGRQVADIDGNGSMVESVYDNAGKLVETIRYMNAMTAAQLATLVDAGGNPTNVALSTLRPTGTAATAWTLYDAAGRVSKQVDQMGFVTETRYDGASRVTDVIRYANATTTAMTAAVVASGVAVVASASLDRHTRTFYDNDGNAVAALDAAGYLTESVYDAGGNLVHTIAYATVSPSAYWTSGTLAQLRPAADSTHDIHAWNYYDAQGRLAGSVDGEGYLTEFGYDVDGHRVRTLRYATKALIAPTAITGSTTLAQLRPSTGASDHTTTAVYNALDQLTSTTDEHGTVTQYTYDNMGRVLTMVSAAATADARTATRTYDVQGRLTGELGGRGSAALAAVGATPAAVWASYGTSYGYDAAGLRTSMTDAAGNKTLYFYDADGHQTFVVDALGEVTETRYNAVNLVSATLRYVKTISVAGLTGGSDSQVSALVAAIHSGASDYSVGYTYDTRNELNRQVDALSYVTTKVYDAFGDEVSDTQGLLGGATETNTTTYDRRGLVTATLADTVAVTGIAAGTAIVRDAFGRATSVTDANGNVTTATYDRLGRAVQATDGMTVGKATTYTTYDAFGRTLTSKDGNGYTTTYTWNDASLTLTMSGPASTSVVTTYDRNGQTISVRNENGVATTTQYDLDGHVVHTIVDSDSGGLALDSRTDYDTAGRILDTVDANGVKTVYAYDAANRVYTRTVDAGGLALITRFTYDGLNDVLTQTDPDGIVTKMTYDAKGEVLTRIVDPTGTGTSLNLTTIFTYDSRGNTATVRDAAGALTTYTYDHLGRRLTMTVDSAPGGLKLLTGYAYDKAGNLTQVTDPRGAVTRYVYDADGRVHYALDNEGGLTETDYDTDGHVTKHIVYATRQSPMMTVVASNGTVTNTMTSAVVTSASDQVAQTTYDANGRRTLVQLDPNGLNLKTQYAYDNAGNVTRVIDPDGNVTRTQYDKASRAVYVLDPANTLTQNSYDKNGRVLNTTTYATPPTGISTVVAANGSVTNTFTGITTSANDKAVQRTYDNAGRQLTSSQVLGGSLLTTRYEYDANGNVTRMTDPAGNVTRCVYDNAGRLRYKLDALSRLTETDYDLAGRIVASIVYGDVQAGITTTQAANGLVTNTVVSITPDAALDRVTRYAYDIAGRLIYTVDPLGNVTANQYDASGNLTVQRHYVTPMDLPTAGSNDGKTVTVSGNTAEVTGAAYVAIDPTHSYTVTVRARQLSGTGQFFAGVITKDASGNVLSNSVAPGGTYAYCAAPGVTLTPDMGWQTFSGSITGTYTPAANTTNTGKQFFAGSTSAAPIILYNYGSSTNGDPGREVEIDSVTLYDNTTSTTINVDPALVNGKTSLAMVSGNFDTAASSPYATLTLAQIKGRLRTSAGDQVTRYAYDYDNRQLYQVDASGVTTKTAYDAAGNVTGRTIFGTPIDLPAAGSTDGRTVTVAGNTAEVTGASYVAIDPTHSYTLTVRARQLSGTGQFYAGVITKDASGNVLSNSVAPGGTYAYCAAPGVTLTPEMGWQTFSGSITGSYTPAANTTNTGKQFFAGSTSAAPLILYNYGSSTNSDPGREVEIDSVTLYDNTTSTTINVDPALFGGDADLAMVSGSFDTASALDAPLTASQISARLRVNPAIDRTTRYAYDAAGRAVLTVDPTGQVTETTYDNDGNAVAARAYATRITVPTDYSAALSATAIRGALSASTASDRITRTVYDADARVIYTVGAKGLVTSYVYDDFGNVSSQTTYATPIDTSALGTALVATDVTSRLTVKPTQDRMTRNVYDALGRVVLSVDPVGQATLTAYDADSRVASVRQLAKVAPIGSAGGTDSQLLATVNANIDDTRDRTTRAFYDADGRQVYAVDGRGYITETRYFTNHTQTIRYANAPALGASPTTASVAASLASSGGATQTTDQYYDADGNATDHVDAAGVTSRNVYDGLGRLVTHIDALGKAEQTTTGYTYDAVGRVLTQTTAQGTAAAATTVNTYDAFGGLLTQVSPQGYGLANVDSAWAQATRAKLGYPSAVASLTPAQKSALLALYTTSHAYDLDGRETTTTNAAGATTTTTYDAFGDAVMVVDPLGNTGYFYFDALGRVTLQVDPVGIATETVYTPGFTDKVASVRRYALTVAAGSYSATTPPALTTNAKDAVTSYTYDADGRVLTATDGAGTESIVYQASANGSLDVFDKVVTNKVGGAATYLYDQGGNETSETLPVTSGGIAVSNTYVYDGFGNRIQSIEGVNLATSAALPEARTTQYRYDAMGRVIYRIGTAYTAADGTAVTPVDSTTYDALGRVIETRTNASWNGSATTGGARTLNYYDAAGNQVMTVAADGAIVALSFTASGKVFKSWAYSTPLSAAALAGLTAGGTPPATSSVPTADRVTTYAYDALDRLTSTSLDGVVSWRQSPLSAGNNDINLTGAGLLLAHTQTMQTLVYDADGNVVQQTDANGNSTFNYYDAAGRKVLSIDPAGYATAWDYNNVAINGTTVYNTFDSPIQQVQYAAQMAPGSWARQGDTSVTNVNLRTPAALRATIAALSAPANTANRITQYVLDTVGRATEQRVLGTAYTYVDATGATTQGTADAVTDTQYDGLGDITQTTQQIGAGNSLVTNYRYDGLGRKIAEVDPVYTDYNAASVRPETDTVYDALGNTASTTQLGSSGGPANRKTTFTYDANGNLATRTDAAGNVTTFTRDAMGRVAKTSVQGIAVLQPVYNGDGSVAFNADGTSKTQLVTPPPVVTTYTYDAMGRQVSQTDVGTGQIQFTKYDVFGDITAKGIGSTATGPIYQEHTTYNVLGKVESSNTGDGATKFYVYDANGNTTRQISSNSIDISGYKLSQLIDPNDAVFKLYGTSLAQTFSIYDARNELVQTVEAKTQFQVNASTESATYTENQVAPYGGMGLPSASAGAGDPSIIGITSSSGSTLPSNGQLVLSGGTGSTGATGAPPPNVPALFSFPFGMYSVIHSTDGFRTYRLTPDMPDATYRLIDHSSNVLAGPFTKIGSNTGASMDFGKVAANTTYPDYLQIQEGDQWVDIATMSDDKESSMAMPSPGPNALGGGIAQPNVLYTNTFGVQPVKAVFVSNVNVGAGGLLKAYANMGTSSQTELTVTQVLSHTGVAIAGMYQVASAVSYSSITFESVDNTGARLTACTFSTTYSNGIVVTPPNSTNVGVSTSVASPAVADTWVDYASPTVPRIVFNGQYAGGSGGTFYYRDATATSGAWAAVAMSGTAVSLPMGSLVNGTYNFRRVSGDGHDFNGQFTNAGGAITLANGGVLGMAVDQPYALTLTIPGVAGNIAAGAQGYSVKLTVTVADTAYNRAAGLTPGSAVVVKTQSYGTSLPLSLVLSATDMANLRTSLDQTTTYNYSYDVYSIMVVGGANAQYVGNGTGSFEINGDAVQPASTGTTFSQPIGVLNLPSDMPLGGTVTLASGGATLFSGTLGTDWRAMPGAPAGGTTPVTVDLSPWFSTSGPPQTFSFTYMSGVKSVTGTLTMQPGGAVSVSGLQESTPQPLVMVAVTNASKIVITYGAGTATIWSASGSWDVTHIATKVSQSFTYQGFDASGAVIGSGSGSFWLDGSGALNVVRPPSPALTFYTPSGTSNPTTNFVVTGATGSVSPQGSGFVFTPISLGDGTYVLTYKGTDSEGFVTTSGTVKLVMLGGVATYSNLQPDIQPIHLQGPSGYHVDGTKMLVAVGGTSVTVGGTWSTNRNAMVFDWMPSSSLPIGTPLPAKLSFLNADGSLYANQFGTNFVLTGTMTLGTAGSTVPSMQQTVIGVSSADEISHYQSFNAFGQVAKEWDDLTQANAKQVAHDFGETANLANVTTNLYYDTRGDLIEKDDPETSVTDIHGVRTRVQPKTTYGYDLTGRMSITVDANGNATRQNYAGGTQQASVQWNPAHWDSTAGAWAYEGKTRTDYDILGSVRRTTIDITSATDQEVIAKDTDILGNLVKVTQLGITRASQFTGAQATFNIVGNQIVDQYAYDAFGRRVAHVNNYGRDDFTMYDTLGRVTQTITAGGMKTSYVRQYVAPTGGSFLGANAQSTGGWRLTTTNADSSSTVDDTNYFNQTTRHVDEGGDVVAYTYNFDAHLSTQVTTLSAQHKADAGGASSNTLRYTYGDNGDILSVYDTGAQTLSEYGYDNAGNRTTEAYGSSVDGIHMQSAFETAQITYDELNRIHTVEDTGVDVVYEYDAVGNRRMVEALYSDPSGGVRKQDDFWYTYDDANRFTMTMGSLTSRGGSIVRGNDGVVITYDLRGDRVSAQDAHTAEGTPDAMETYTYTVDGYLQSTSVNGQTANIRVDDALGRTLDNQTLTWSGGVSTTHHQTSVYDWDNRLQTQTDENGTTTFSYFNSAYVEGGGTQASSLTGKGQMASQSTLTSGASPTTSTVAYTYTLWDSADQLSITTTTGSTTATTTEHYNAEGFLVEADSGSVAQGNAKRSVYTLSATGQVMSAAQFSGVNTKATDTRYYYYADGHTIGDISDSVNPDNSRLSYAEEWATVTKQGVIDTSKYKTNQPVLAADFDQNYQPINATYPASAPSSYTARTGDTLRSIARNQWGDADMWYLIAQANNLSASATLVAGEILTIPNKVTNIHNNATTFRPYDPGAAIGNIDPTLPPPPAPAASGGGCGTIGTIIMVVVAVVVTIYTCGAAAELLAAAGTAAAGTTGFAATMALGGSVLAGTAGAAVGVGLAGAAVGVAAAAIGGAVGSIAAQAVGDAMGNTKGFSWKQVATAAIGSAVTAGVGEAFAPAATATSVGTTAAQSAGGLSSLTLSGVGHAMEVAAASTAVQEAVKGEWSWRQIAASAVGAAAGQAAGAAMTSAIGATNAVSVLAQRTAAGMGSGWAQQEVLATDHNYTRARSSSLFANSLGEAIGEGIVDEIVHMSLPAAVQNMSLAAQKQAIALSQQYSINLSDPTEAANLTDMVRMLNEPNAVTSTRRSDLTDFALGKLGLTDAQRTDVMDLARSTGALPSPQQTSSPDSSSVKIEIIGTKQQYTPALGDDTVDQLAIHTGDFVEEVGKAVHDRPWLSAGITTLNVMAAPVAFAVNKAIDASPIGDAIHSAEDKVQGFISGQFTDVGYTPDRSVAGGVGSMAVLGAVAGFGATKVLSMASEAFASFRKKLSVPQVFTKLEDFVRETNDPMRNTKYVYNNVGWKTDALARLETVEGPVAFNAVGRNDLKLQRSIGYNGETTDVGFHVWPDQWGGPTSTLNVVPGNGRSIGDGLRNLNNGDYADFERQVSALAADPANKVEARVTLDYAEGNASRRPDTFSVSYRLNGGEWSVPKQLENKWNR